MEDQSSKIIAAFDSLFTTNRIQILKILLPRLAPEHQSGFAVYIKLLELQYTLSFLHRHPGNRLFGTDKQLSANFFQGDNTDTISLLDELLPFSDPEGRTKIENMKNMLANMKKMQEMMEMIQMIQELFPEGAGGDNPMDFFTSMSGMPNMSGMFNMPDMDLSSLFQMFGNHTEPDDNPAPDTDTS